MVTVDKAVIARLKAGGSNFEVLVDCDKALEFRSGKSVSIREILAVEEIFSDSKKGMKASATQLKQIFGTEDPLEIAAEIIKKGDIQVTAQYRNKLREQKKKQIIDIIHRNGINPLTHTPHPPERIEAAMEEAKVKIDESKPAEQQVTEILRKLQPIIPIKFETIKLEIKIPPQHTGKTYQMFRKFGKILKEEWLSDGSHLTVLEIPAGLEQELYGEINKFTHGENEITKVN